MININILNMAKQPFWCYVLDFFMLHFPKENEALFCIFINCFDNKYAFTFKWKVKNYHLLFVKDESQTVIFCTLLYLCFSPSLLFESDTKR